MICQHAAMVLARVHLWCRSGAALAAALLMLVHGIATLLHPAAPPPWRAGTLSGATQQTVVLCTAHGLQSIVIDADGNPVEGPAPGEQRTSCPLCLAFGVAPLTAPEVQLTRPQRPTATPSHPNHDDDVPRSRYEGDPRNRGPPPAAA